MPDKTSAVLAATAFLSSAMLSNPVKAMILAPPSTLGVAAGGTGLVQQGHYYRYSRHQYGRYRPEFSYYGPYYSRWGFYPPYWWQGGWWW
jgi:hypothetical protein